MKGGCFISYGELKKVRDIVHKYYIMVEHSCKALALRGDSVTESDIELLHRERVLARSALDIIENVKE